MNRRETVEELMARAQLLGLRLEFDCGLMTVTPMTNAEPDRQRAIVEELGKHISELRNLLERQAVVARTKQLLGRPVWSPEYGEGTIANANPGTGLSISIQNAANRGPSEFMASAEGVLIIMEADWQTTPMDAPPKPDKPTRGFFDSLFSRRGGN